MDIFDAGDANHRKKLHKSVETIEVNINYQFDIFSLNIAQNHVFCNQVFLELW